MWDVLEPRIDRSAASWRGVRLRPGGTGHHPQRLRGDADLDRRLDLKRGDEVVVSDQNYPRMLTAWDQRARRDGVVVKRISFGGRTPARRGRRPVSRAAMTPRTRVVEITHVVNLTGNILPVREVVAMARNAAAETFVDGAHAFAHFPFPSRRPRLRLLRHQPAQVAPRPGRHGVPVCQEIVHTPRSGRSWRRNR